jgi:3-demethoxyubiquinol 3-hydroxylase
MRPVDQFIFRLDRFLRTVAAPAGAPARKLPTIISPPAEPEPMSEPERRHAAGLMRVNHSGEVAAQALYEGQALFARDAEVRKKLEAAGAEERDHLAWTETRLRELNASPSALNPIWYAGAFVLGAACAAVNDKLSASFLRETERQVEAHLTSHLATLPENDTRSREIVSAMREDEAKHAQTAEAMGGEPLPLPFRAAMRAGAKVMTKTAYHL